MELNLIALVCKQDQEALQRSGLIGPGTGGQPFSVAPWTENRIVRRDSPPLRSTEYRVSHFLFEADRFEVLRADGADASMDLDERLVGCNAILLFAGPNSAGRNGIADLIERVAADPSCKPFFVVFALCADSGDVVGQLGTLRLPHFRIPGEEQIIPLNGDRSGNLRNHQWEFADAVKEVQEAQLEQPTLGVGALLVSRDEGLFFLSRRTWKNGYDMLGTFGGPLQANGTVVDTVLRYGEQRFRIQRSQITAGPMLACTNMRGENGHYVDMTFLFTTPRRLELSVEGTKWCTITQMQQYLEQGRLYTPVANAFMRYCALESYNRLSRALVSPPALSWIQPDYVEAAALPTDQLLEVATLLRSNEPRKELWPLFFESR
ncbi:hypothetical protein [Actinomadura sp.]|uniref:hypothetical protein n=1 Tax=Actinomadura sp. TaxID=1989 RepID=UPI0037C69043